MWIHPKPQKRLPNEFLHMDVLHEREVVVGDEELSYSYTDPHFLQVPVSVS